MERFSGRNFFILGCAAEQVFSFCCVTHLYFGEAEQLLP